MPDIPAPNTPPEILPRDDAVKRFHLNQKEQTNQMGTKDYERHIR
jgi:hypothetical protein